MWEVTNCIDTDIFFLIIQDMNQDQAHYTNVMRQRVETSLRTMTEEHLKKQG